MNVDNTERLRCYSYDTTGALFSATAPVLTIEHDEGLAPYVTPGLTEISTGVFEGYWTPTVAGRYNWHWEFQDGSGNKCHTQGTYQVTERI